MRTGAVLRGSLVCLVAILPSLTTAQAQGDANRSAVAGRVQDSRSGAPVPGAIIEILGRSHRAETDSAGAFRFANLPADLIRLRIRGVGYVPLERSLMLREGRESQLALELTPNAPRLPAVTVTAEAESPGIMAGFRDRQRMGIGTFFGDAELLNDPRRGLVDLLRHVPGLRIGGRGGGVAFSSRRSCPLTVILDGQVLVGNAISLHDLPVIGSYAGIEVYPGQASLPSQFRVLGSECGAIVLWSRRGSEGRGRGD